MEGESRRSTPLFALSLRNIADDHQSLGGPRVSLACTARDAAIFDDCNYYILRTRRTRYYYDDDDGCGRVLKDGNARRVRMDDNDDVSPATENVPVGGRRLIIRDD